MPSFGSALKTSQETAISVAFEKDGELWMAFFAYYIKSRGEVHADIKQGLLDLNPTWLVEMDQIKKEGFKDMCGLCSEKTMQWSMRIKRLLTDADYANVLQLYLRCLTALRTRKIDPAFPDANIHRQVNLALSSIGSELNQLLDPYMEVTRCLERKVTLSGKDLTQISLQYYTERQGDLLNQISTYLAMIFLLKDAKKIEDIDRCQKVMRRNLIKPLEVKIESLKGSEKKESWGKLDAYYKVLWSIDVQFG
jgi:hypothetical protein